MRFQSFLQWLPVALIIAEIYIVYKRDMEIDTTVQLFFGGCVVTGVVLLFFVSTLVAYSTLAVY